MNAEFHHPDVIVECIKKSASKFKFKMNALEVFKEVVQPLHDSLQSYENRMKKNRDEARLFFQDFPNVEIIEDGCAIAQINFSTGARGVPSFIIISAIKDSHFYDMMVLLPGTTKRGEDFVSLEAAFREGLRVIFSEKERVIGQPAKILQDYVNRQKQPI